MSAVRHAAAAPPRFIETRLQRLLARKRARRGSPPYETKNEAEVEAALRALFTAEGLQEVRIGGLRRLAGGASKEQFAFELRHAGQSRPERLVLRMDPREGVVETCRLREAQMLLAIAGVVPVPEVRFVDADGDYLGQPGMITSFVAGVTKPTEDKAAAVSGLGSSYGSWVDKLAPQFLKYLIAIHDFTPSSTAQLDSFDIPAAGTRDAALWQVDFWGQVRRDDLIEPVPMLSYTESWLRERAPVCARACVVHGDYRIGNFMFEEPSGRFTAVLDWELVHFGDFHEDLAWLTQKLLMTPGADGRPLVSGLLPREEFLQQYQALSGRVIDAEKLRYYEVLNTWKCAVMNLCSGPLAARHAANHQDLLLSWLPPVGPVCLAQTIELIKGQSKGE